MKYSSYYPVRKNKASMKGACSEYRTAEGRERERKKGWSDNRYFAENDARHRNCRGWHRGQNCRGTSNESILLPRKKRHVRISCERAASLVKSRLHFHRTI